MDGSGIRFSKAESERVLLGLSIDYSVLLLYDDIEVVIPYIFFYPVRRLIDGCRPG